MDPKACLEEIRRLVHQMNDMPFETSHHTDQDSDVADIGIELSIKIAELDQWLSNGGFSPWDSGHDAGCMCSDCPTMKE